MSMLAPGFPDAVRDNQACFRAVLDAMAGPGGVYRVPGPAVPFLDSATAAVLLTLVDQDTPLFLAPEFASAAAWLRFHCGAALVPAAQAAFAVMPVPDFTAVPAGTHEAPEDGATIVLQVASFGAGAALRLSGPGLETSRPVRVEGLPVDFVALWAANAGLFPRGVDLILCAGDQLMALPRTVVIEASVIEAGGRGAA